MEQLKENEAHFDNGITSIARYFPAVKVKKIKKGRRKGREGGDTDHFTIKDLLLYEDDCTWAYPIVA